MAEVPRRAERSRRDALDESRTLGMRNEFVGVEHQVWCFWNKGLLIP